MNPPRSSVAAAVGRTPLIKLRRASEETGCTILGKAEFMNPGAVGQRPRRARHHHGGAWRAARLRPGGTVVEGTAGNTGIGLTVLGNALGLRTVIVIPNTQSQEKKDTLRLLGAEVVEVPAVPYRDANNYVKYSARLAEALAATEPGGASGPTSSTTPPTATSTRRPRPRRSGPTPRARSMALSRAVGTGGTLGGVSRGLKAKREGIAIALADPPGSGLYSYFTTGEFKPEGSSVTEGSARAASPRTSRGRPSTWPIRSPTTRPLRIVFALTAEEGPVRRRLDRRQCRRRHTAGPRAGAWSHDRDDPVRQRHALPVAAVQPGVSGRQVFTRSRLAGSARAAASVGF